MKSFHVASRFSTIILNMQFLKDNFVSL